MKNKNPSPHGVTVARRKNSHLESSSSADAGEGKKEPSADTHSQEGNNLIRKRLESAPKGEIREGLLHPTLNHKVEPDTLSNEDMEDFLKCYSEWSKFIDYVTKGKMSKPNYTFEAMKEVFDEVQQPNISKAQVREDLQEIYEYMFEDTNNAIKNLGKYIKELGIEEEKA